ncbi:hypothetical protein [Luteimonas mephitis]|uniref:hypothetical protein n=1 Tax=Luteimonas mephitis TaxID=83615 RepID=UPI000686B235|nr:hypothetical protein [Luteimonas mephitis]
MLKTMRCQILLFVIALPLLPVAARDVASETSSRASVSSRMFINASDRWRGSDSADDEGLALELTRFFVNARVDLDSEWSAHITTDVVWTRNDDPSSPWLRYAYLQRRLGDAAVLRLGSAPLPWINAESAQKGYRYVDAGLVSRSGLGTSADYGLHMQGGDGWFNYGLSVVTGGGYKRPRLGRRADVEARFGWTPVESVELAVGGYRGSLARKGVDGRHPPLAQRWNVLTTWTGKRAKVGAQYIRAHNWSGVPCRSHGWSGWSSYQIARTGAVFVRHDHTSPSREPAAPLAERYSQVGVEWKASDYLRVALVGKQMELKSSAHESESNEFGVWGELLFR